MLLDRPQRPCVKIARRYVNEQTLLTLEATKQGRRSNSRSAIPGAPLAFHFSSPCARREMEKLVAAHGGIAESG